MRRFALGVLLLVGLALTVAGAAVTHCATQDFHGFVVRRRSPLAEVRVEGRGASGAFSKSWLRLASTGGLAVECGVLAPLDASRRHAAIVLLGGRDAGKHSIDNARDLPDVVLASPDFNLEGQDPNSFWEALEIVPEARARIFDVPVEAMLVADYLRSRPDVDPRRIVLVGVSFGALFVPCTAAEDRRFAAAVMVDGGGGLTSLIRHNLEPWTDTATSRAGGLLGGLLLRPMEPLRFAGLVAPTPLVLVNGSADELVPRENVEALFARAKEPRKLLWVDAPHVDPKRPELIARIIRIVEGELRALKVL